MKHITLSLLVLVLLMSACGAVEVEKEAGKLDNQTVTATESVEAGEVTDQEDAVEEKKTDADAEPVEEESVDTELANPSMDGLGNGR